MTTDELNLKRWTVICKEAILAFRRDQPKSEATDSDILQEFLEYGYRRGTVKKLGDDFVLPAFQDEASYQIALSMLKGETPS